MGRYVLRAKELGFFDEHGHRACDTDVDTTVLVLEIAFF